MTQTPHQHVHADDQGHRHDGNQGHGQEHDHTTTTTTTTVSGGLVGYAMHSRVRWVRSHDAADQIDDALEANAAGRRALLISLIGLGVTALLQAVVVVLSGSVALLGDTLHNVADALTALLLLVAFTLARRPANKRFTYGYGRAEDLGGLFVIAMILLSSVVAAYEGIDRLLHPREVSHLWAVASAALVGFMGNELVQCLSFSWRLG